MSATLQFKQSAQTAALCKQFLAGRNLSYLLTPFSLTPFSKAVLEETAKIPFGQTLAYSEIAKKIDRPKACRAVAQALHYNPVPLFIPCHRVIAKDGSLGGYAFGIDLKEKILLLEREHLRKKLLDISPLGTILASLRVRTGDNNDHKSLGKKSCKT